tara:strand:- start:466 stop:744 length:279 start_codon:yes stop_codon:yes gene_type:complete
MFIFINEGLMIKTVLLVIFIFLLFLLYNQGLRWVYIPKSIFPRDFEKTENNSENNEKNQQKNNFFNNKKYSLFPKWAVGKYKQVTNNEPLSI